MTALARDRNTPQRRGEDMVLPVAANKVIYSGALVAADADGNATPGATSTTLRAVGRAEETVINNPGLAGAQTVKVSRGVFKFANDATTPVTAAHIMKDCYIVDDQTVASTDGSTSTTSATRSKAGRVLGVESDGVWVEIADPRKMLDTRDASLPGNIGFTIGAEAAAIRVTAQLKTLEDENPSEKKVVEAWLSDAAGGALCGTAPSGTVVIGTKGVIIEALTAKLHFNIITDATGAFDLDITEAGAKDLYLNVAWNGRVFSSAKITFTA